MNFIEKINNEAKANVKYIKTVEQISKRTDISHLEKKILYKAVIMVMCNDTECSGYDEEMQNIIEGYEDEDEKRELGE